MKIENLKFSICDNSRLTLEEKIYLLDIYRDLFKIIYGFDIFEEMLKNSDNNESTSIIFKDNYKFVVIRDKKKNLIGAGRIKVDEEVITVKDIAIGIGSREEKREIWKKAIEYTEEYYKKKRFKKMYVDVPIAIPHLLFRADDLGFKEDPEDIIVSYDNKMYTLQKDLESTK